jgi:hypothetical protein
MLSTGWIHREQSPEGAPSHFTGAGYDDGAGGEGHGSLQVPGWSEQPQADRYEATAVILRGVMESTAGRGRP